MMTEERWKMAVYGENYKHFVVERSNPISTRHFAVSEPRLNMNYAPMSLVQVRSRSEMVTMVLIHWERKMR